VVTSKLSSKGTEQSPSSGESVAAAKVACATDFGLSLAFFILPTAMTVALVVDLLFFVDGASLFPALSGLFGDWLVLGRGDVPLGEYSPASRPFTIVMASTCLRNDFGLTFLAVLLRPLNMMFVDRSSRGES
jgi:hypothetical protein